MNTQNIFIISGPTGTGKDSIIERLAHSLPLERIVTTTVRPPRPGETEGHPYYFVSQEIFDETLREGGFAEYSTNENGVRYGVTHQELKRVSECVDRIGIWEIDWKGVQTAKRIFPGILAILIRSPLSVLEERIRLRDATKDEQYFTERLSYAKEWLEHVDIYDYIVENEQGKLEQAVEEVKHLLRKHAHISTL